MSFLKSIWKKDSKHKKLSEELALKNAKGAEAEEQQPQPTTPENDKDVMTFKLKYLGCTVVEKVIGENMSPEAVKNVIKVAKASGKKIPRVNVAISLKGVNVTDSKGNHMFDVSIYRISNCSTDKQFRQVFSFISVDSTETMECHAFWCSKRKMAEMVALTVAHAFSTAYESWRQIPNIGEMEKAGEIQNENMKNTLNTMKNNLMDTDDVNEIKNKEIIEEKLIDFDDDPVGINISYSTYTNNPNLFDLNAKNQWVCFEDDFGNALLDDIQNDSFECDFENNFHNDLGNIFQTNVPTHFQNELQGWNNSNKIDLFF